MLIARQAIDLENELRNSTSPENSEIDEKEQLDKLRKIRVSEGVWYFKQSIPFIRRLIKFFGIPNSPLGSFRLLDNSITWDTLHTDTRAQNS